MVQIWAKRTDIKSHQKRQSHEPECPLPVPSLVVAPLSPLTGPLRNTPPDLPPPHFPPSRRRLASLQHQSLTGWVLRTCATKLSHQFGSPASLAPNDRSSGLVPGQRGTDFRSELLGLQLCGSRGRPTTTCRGRKLV